MPSPAAKSFFSSVLNEQYSDLFEANMGKYNIPFPRTEIRPQHRKRLKELFSKGSSRQIIVYLSKHGAPIPKSPKEKESLIDGLRECKQALFYKQLADINQSIADIIFQRDKDKPKLNRTLKTQFKRYRTNVLIGQLADLIKTGESVGTIDVFLQEYFGIKLDPDEISQLVPHLLQQAIQYSQEQHKEKLQEFQTAIKLCQENPPTSPLYNKQKVLDLAAFLYLQATRIAKQIEEQEKEFSLEKKGALPVEIRTGIEKQLAALRTLSSQFKTDIDRVNQDIAPYVQLSDVKLDRMISLPTVATQPEAVIVRKKSELSETAHFIAKGTLRKTGQLVFYKPMEQEPQLAQLEAAFTQCFRLLIGNQASDGFTVRSENQVIGYCSIGIKGFQSIRDLEGGWFGWYTHDPQKRDKASPAYLAEHGLAKILVACYLFEEDDLHKSNFGIDESNQVCKIDHGRSFFSSVIHRLKRIKIEARSHPTTDWPITARDIRNFPQLKDTNPGYWPTIYRLISRAHNRFTYIDTDRFSQLKDNPIFIQTKYESFLQTLLTPISLITRNFEDHLSDQSVIKLLKEHWQERHAQLKKVLLSMPEFQSFVLRENNLKTVVGTTFNLLQNELNRSHLYVTDFSALRKLIEKTASDIEEECKKRQKESNARLKKAKLPVCFKSFVQRECLVVRLQDEIITTETKSRQGKRVKRDKIVSKAVTDKKIELFSREFGTLLESNPTPQSIQELVNHRLGMGITLDQAEQFKKECLIYPLEKKGKLPKWLEPIKHIFSKGGKKLPVSIEEHLGIKPAVPKTSTQATEQEVPAKKDVETHRPYSPLTQEISIKGMGSGSDLKFDKKLFDSLSSDDFGYMESAPIPFTNPLSKRTETLFNVTYEQKTKTQTILIKYDSQKNEYCLPSISEKMNETDIKQRFYSVVGVAYAMGQTALDIALLPDHLKTTAYEYLTQAVKQLPDTGKTNTPIEIIDSSHQLKYQKLSKKM